MATTPRSIPQYLQIRQNGVDIGGPDADTLDLIGVSATRGSGATANVITITITGGDIDTIVEAVLAALGPVVQNGLTPSSTTLAPSVDSVVTGLSVKAAKTQAGGLSSGISGSVADADYIVLLKAPFGGAITETTSRCNAGSATVTWAINGSGIGGTANSMTNTRSSQAHSGGSASFSLGDTISYTVSAASGCSDSINEATFTRTLG